MRYLNVFTRKEFTTVEGKTKRSWNQVGVVRISGKGRMYLQLHLLPDTEFYLFEPQGKDGVVASGDLDEE